MRKFLLVVFVTSTFLKAQTPDTATLRGTVVDRSGAVVPGASIVVSNTGQNVQRSATTDNSGRFAIVGIPASGDYTVKAQKTGFADAVDEHVRFEGGSTATLDLKLSPASTAVEVNVTGAAGEARTDEPQVGTFLSPLMVQETPLLNRRITSLPLLNSANRPAISQGDIFVNQTLFTTNGAGRRQTYFVVDGSSAVDLWGRQTVFTNLPLESVHEMQVLTNAFSAEYGGTTGGIVNVVTNQGRSGFHGSALGMWRPAEASSRLAGFNRFTAPNGNAIASDTARQSALALSAPLGGKTYAFVSGEYTWQNRVSPVISPVAPGNFEGHYRGWLASGRIDHQINDKNNLFLRASADAFHDTNPSGVVGGQSLPTVDRVFKRRTYMIQADEEMQISSRVLNDLRAHFDLGSPITEFDPLIFATQVQVPIVGVGTFTSGTSQAAKLLNHQYGLDETVSAALGQHTLHFGGSVLHAHSGGNSKEFGGPLYLGQFVYKPCSLGAAVCESSAYLSNLANVSSYTQAYGNANYAVDDTLWSLFAQDDFRVARSLTLNLGLRYERQTLTQATKDFAPRIGFAYDAFGTGKTVFRGGYGIYYSTIPDNTAANWALTGPTGVFNFTAQAGQVGFPTSTTAVPLPAFPAGAVAPIRTLYLQPGHASYYDQFFPTNTLIGYQSKLLDPYAQQWTFGVENDFGGHWVLGLDYVGSRTLRVNRPLDVDPPTSFARSAQGQSRGAGVANCTRPLWVAFYAANGQTCGAKGAATPAYALIQSDVNDGYGNYHALTANLRHTFANRFEGLVSYTWSHALSNVDPDVPGQNPNDPRFTGHQEYGPSIFDQRHRFVASGVFQLPWAFRFGGVASLGSGLPYNIVTGSTNSGDNGATTDRPVINGAVVGRNAGHGRALYDVSPFLERPISFTERVKLNLRAEAFNVMNHPNFVGYIGTYGNNDPTKVPLPATFGTPNVGIASQLPARSVQFEARLSF